MIILLDLSTWLIKLGVTSWQGHSLDVSLVIDLQGQNKKVKGSECKL